MAWRPIYLATPTRKVNRGQGRFAWCTTYRLLSSIGLTRRGRRSLSWRCGTFPELAALLDRPGALLFVKSSRLDELLAALPPVLPFVPAAKEGGVTVRRVVFQAGRAGSGLRAGGV